MAVLILCSHMTVYNFVQATPVFVGCCMGRSLVEDQQEIPMQSLSLLRWVRWGAFATESLYNTIRSGLALFWLSGYNEPSLAGAHVTGARPVGMGGASSNP